MMKPHKKTEQGFTLIELMIVVAIVGILAAIAFPSYQESVRKSARAEAKAALLGAAQAFERYYSLNGRYDSLGASPANIPTFSGDNAASKKYDLTYVYKDAAGAAITPVNATATNPSVSFEITATPVITDSKCGNLLYTNTGKKTISLASPTTAQINYCWK